MHWHAKKCAVEQLELNFKELSLKPKAFWEPQIQHFIEMFSMVKRFELKTRKLRLASY